jgi:acyl carrier protein
MKKNNEKILRVLKIIFSKSKIPRNIDKLKIGDIKEWDSLGNFNLLLEIEKTFKIRIDTKSFNNIKSIKDIKQYLKKSENR